MQPSAIPSARVYCGSEPLARSSPVRLRGKTRHLRKDNSDSIQLDSRLLRVTLIEIARSATSSHFGWLAHFAAIVCPASSERTRELRGWQPEPAWADTRSRPAAPFRNLKRDLWRFRPAMRAEAVSCQPHRRRARSRIRSTGQGPWPDLTSNLPERAILSPNDALS
jgi:hypothetical protein